jgi:hypothetical protein
MTAAAVRSSSAKQPTSEAPNQEIFRSSGAIGTPLTRETSQRPMLTREVPSTATAVVIDQAEITAIARDVSMIWSARRIVSARVRSP